MYKIADEKTLRTALRGNFQGLIMGAIMALYISIFPQILQYISVCLTGKLLEVADWGGMIISAFGFFLIIYSFLKDKASAPEKGINKLSSLITVLEWLLGIGGLISSILTTTNDYNSNWSG